MRKIIKLVLICIAFNSQTRAITTFDNFPDPMIISLGFDCTIARVLRDNDLRSFAFPFDWIRSSFAGVCNLFEEDFVDLLDPQYLSCEGDYILNGKYTVAFYHDFPVFEDYLNSLVDIKKKYMRRIRRLYRALNSGHKIYLFRCSSRIKPWNLDPGPQGVEEIKKLRDILISKFPKCNFTLVAISSDANYKTNWEIEHIKNFYIEDYTPESTEWITILKTLKLLHDPTN